MPIWRRAAKVAKAKQPARIPLQELIKEGKLPAFGERFRLEQLPEMSKAVFKRISQIYGIPVAELMPRHIERKKETGYRGKFNADGYIIHFSKSRKNAVRTLGHELLHAAQLVMGGFFPRYRFGDLSTSRLVARYSIPAITNRALREITAGPFRVNVKRGVNVARSTAIPPKELALPGSIERLVVDAIGNVAGMAFILPVHLVKRFYIRHGTDGLMLLYAIPPKGHTNLFVNLWERRMVNAGLLEKEGGLTEAGINFLRAIRPRGRILFDLEEARKRFKKEEYK